MVKNASVFYSNVDPDSLVYKGEQFNHLHKVNSRKADDLMKQLKLKPGLPPDEIASTTAMQNKLKKTSY
ncbi:hypothetical protein CU097_015446 [Rhizopus azygosporus]|uniref:Uncharacterized protein n=1 Tax=Rhizopus azygosporus TaxID=86630 RepID=A0A367K8Z1_RHIAZ|nr:hypothetical protein CU097_015446 [Rhizopus azygosporus]